MCDVAWNVFPFWLRGWGWWTLTGILHKLDKILSHPTPSVLEVLLAIVEVTESGVSETQQDEQSIQKFSLQCSHIAINLHLEDQERILKTIHTLGHHTGYTQNCELYSQQRHKQPGQQDKQCFKLFNHNSISH